MKTIMIACFTLAWYGLLAILITHWYYNFPDIGLNLTTGFFVCFWLACAGVWFAIYKLVSEG